MIGYILSFMLHAYKLHIGRLCFFLSLSSSVWSDWQNVILQSIELLSLLGRCKIFLLVRFQRIHGVGLFFSITQYPKEKAGSKDNNTNLSAWIAPTWQEKFGGLDITAAVFVLCHYKARWLAPQITLAIWSSPEHLLFIINTIVEEDCQET